MNEPETRVHPNVILIMERVINDLRSQNAELRECLKVKDEALKLAKHQYARIFAITVDQLETIKTPFDKALAAQPDDVLESKPSDLLTWAIQRWNDEVSQRPLVNIHRRALDDTWRQVIRYAGGNPDELIGPCHDALLAAQPEDSSWNTLLHDMKKFGEDVAKLAKPEVKP